MKRFDVYFWLFMALVCLFNVESHGHWFFVMGFVVSCTMTGIMAGMAVQQHIADMWRAQALEYRRELHEQIDVNLKLVQVAKELIEKHQQRDAADSSESWKDQP